MIKNKAPQNREEAEAMLLTALSRADKDHDKEALDAFIQFISQTKLLRDNSQTFSSALTLSDLLQPGHTSYAKYMSGQYDSQRERIEKRCAENQSAARKMILKATHEIEKIVKQSYRATDTVAILGTRIKKSVKVLGQALDKAKRCGLRIYDCPHDIKRGLWETCRCYGTEQVVKNALALVIQMQKVIRLRVSGIHGSWSSANGLYSYVKYAHGSPIYRDDDSGTKWVFIGPEGKWGLWSLAAQLEERKRQRHIHKFIRGEVDPAGECICRANGTVGLHPGLTDGWQQVESSRWVVAKDFVLETFSAKTWAAEEVKIKVAAALLERAQETAAVLRCKGAEVGESRVFNGVYDVADTMRHGQPRWVKRGDQDKYFEIDATRRRWEGKARAETLVRSMGSPGDNPSKAKKWKAWSKHKQAFVVQALVIQVFSRAEWADEQERLDKITAAILIKAGQEASVLVMSGMSGPMGMRCNGTYSLVVGKAQNMRPLYRQEENTDLWLRMGPEGDWIVSNTQDKNKNNSIGYCYSVGRRDTGSNNSDRRFLYPPENPKQILAFDETARPRKWKVVNDGSVDIQLAVRVARYSQAEWASVQAQRKAAEREAVEVAERAAILSVRGATGPHATKINGFYHLSRTKKKLLLVNNRPAYIRREGSGKSNDDQTYLVVGANGKWAFGLKEEGNGDHISALCHSSGLAAAINPTAEPHWFGQKALEIRVLSADEWELLSKEIKARKKFEDDSVAVAKDRARHLILSGVQSRRADHPARDNLVNGTYSLIEGRVHNGRPCYKQVVCNVSATPSIIK